MDLNLNHHLQVTASESLSTELIDEKKEKDTNSSSGRRKAPKRPNAFNRYGVIENGHVSSPESITENHIQSREMQESSTERPNSTKEGNFDEYPQQLTSSAIGSVPLNVINNDDSQILQQIEPNTTANHEDEGGEYNSNYNYNIVQESMTKPQKEQKTSKNDSLVSSCTTLGENDTIEIHEFSAADVDAYLDIYFEILENRLRHFIGNDEQVREFRIKLKERLYSDSNSREYRNVLLGKINGEVVAAVTLAFYDESTTVLNNNILPDQNSCMTSFRRWMTRNANYVPRRSDECYIEMLGVKSTHRNCGIGTALLECVEYFAQEAGAQILTVHSNRPDLTSYFERYGFAIDRSDNSAFWKWAVERENIIKMAKVISFNYVNEDPVDNTSGYLSNNVTESE